MANELQVNLSELSEEEIYASNHLLASVDLLWQVGKKSRKRIYHRWQLLGLLTPTIAAQFEDNLQRIHKVTR